MALRLLVNGREREFLGLMAPVMLSGVIAELGLQADRVAVEWNGQIARRASWDTVVVGDGDRLEVVHFVGGGWG